MPADLLIFSSKNESVFIKTDQIDGETDLKVRKAYAKSDELTKSNDLLKLQSCEVEIYPKSNSLNWFDGKVAWNELNQDGEQIQDPLTLENTVWSGCAVKNNEIVGLVIAVGSDTRLQKNSSNSKKLKSTYVDKKINQFSVVLFLIMSSVSLIDAILKGSFKAKLFVVSFSRFVVLFSFMIPISIKLFIMLGRFGFSQNIMKDQEIPDTVVKTETIVDELGKVEVILSDKTGTIT